jgi:hypothetical protein
VNREVELGLVVHCECWFEGSSDVYLQLVA